MSEKTYAGDVLPKQAWDMLAKHPKAVLVDVRTDAEFAYVGNPDLGGLGKQVLRVYWKVFPAMDSNPNFVAEVKKSGVAKDAPLLFLCRSGVRSRDAAIAMTAAGFKECYNVAGGFEGDKDATGHRGTVNGWKVAGLPWIQG
ncbi:MAG: rhodanese-like domain-containing protein [Rhodospirillales bacterium]